MTSWWPDGGTTPFRGEKATTWEGGVRVPMLLRWPAKVAKGKVSNGIQTHEDLFTTLAAAAGAGDLAAKLRESHKVHIDGVDNLDALDRQRAVAPQLGHLLQRERTDRDACASGRGRRT
jgi:arylsulfatase A-like enzyme